jgi:hypothetical protein
MKAGESISREMKVPCFPNPAIAERTQGKKERTRKDMEAPHRPSPP